MTGHNAIVDLRLQGHIPNFCDVCLLDKPAAYLWGWDEPERAMENMFPPQVHILPDENLYALDFRFLHGLTVNISTHCAAQRTLDAFNRIIEFEPQIAVVCIDYPEYGWMGIYERDFHAIREHFVDRRYAA